MEEEILTEKQRELRIFINGMSGFNGLYEPVQKRLTQLLSTLASQHILPNELSVKKQGVDNDNR